MANLDILRSLGQEWTSGLLLNPEEENVNLSPLRMMLSLGFATDCK